MLLFKKTLFHYYYLITEWKNQHRSASSRSSDFIKIHSTKEKHELFKMLQECLSVDTGKKKKNNKKNQKNQACKKNYRGS